MQSIDSKPLPIMLYTPWYKKLFGLCIGIGFTFLGYWMIGEDTPTRKYSVEMIHVIGWLCMLMFTAVTLLALYQIFRPAPVMVIDDKGVAVLGALGRTKRIAWKDMGDIYIERIQSNNILTMMSASGQTKLTIGGMRLPVKVQALADRIALIAEKKGSSQS